MSTWQNLRLTLGRRMLPRPYRSALHLGVGIVNAITDVMEESTDRVVASLEDGQEALNLAAATAAQRVSGDGWYWDRRNSAQDASPLVAATLPHEIEAWLQQQELGENK